MTDDVRKLLGGFATGTLSEAERQILFEAALHDDQLFAALADEQALKELLEDSSVRATLLRATEEPRFSVTAALREWFEAPKSKVLVAVGCVVFTLIAFKELRPVAQKTTQVAEVREPAAVRSLPQPSSPQASSADAVQPPGRSPAARKQAAAPPREKRAAETDGTPPPPPLVAPAPSELATAPPAGVVGGVVGGIVAESEMRASSRQARMADQAAPAAAASPAPPAIPLGWELLLRNADGEFRPVARDHEFGAGDAIRVRVKAARSGAVALSIPGQPTVTGSIEANEAASIPDTGGIAIGSTTSKIVLGFAATGTDAAANRLFRQEAAKTKETAPQSLTIEIPIRHRIQ